MVQAQLVKLEQMTNDNAWFYNNFKKVQSKFEGQFIAIESKKIISSAKSVDELILKIKKMNKDPAMLLIEFVTPKGETIII